MPAKRTIALLGALVCALIAAVTWALAFRTGLGQAADARVLGGLKAYQQTRLGPLASSIGQLGNPLPYAMMCLAACALALRRGVWTSVVVAAVLIVPNVITQVLKQELAETRVGNSVDAVSWPSGHSTAAAALALALLLVAPVGWRAVVGLAGAAFAVAMATSVVLLGWHLPSDAVGGFAIAGTAACLAAALLSRPAATTVPQNRWHRATG